MDFLILKVSLNSLGVCVWYFSIIRRFLKRIPLRDRLFGGSCVYSSLESVEESELVDELSYDVEDDDVEVSELEPSELEADEDDAFESGLLDICGPDS